MQSAKLWLPKLGKLYETTENLASCILFRVSKKYGLYMREQSFFIFILPILTWKKSCYINEKLIKDTVEWFCKKNIRMCPPFFNNLSDKHTHAMHTHTSTYTYIQSSSLMQTSIHFSIPFKNLHSQLLSETIKTKLIIQ